MLVQNSILGILLYPECYLCLPFECGMFYDFGWVFSVILEWNGTKIGDVFVYGKENNI